MQRKTSSMTAFAAAAGLIALGSAASAQGPRAGSEQGWGPGSMMGPGMMGSRGLGFMCNPRAAGMAEWRMERIESAVKPNDAQKVLIKDLRDASTKAAETMKAACTGDVPAKSTERMALMEKRLEAMLAASRTVRPAFEKLYTALDDAQRKKLDSVGPRRWGWERWHWPWNDRQG